MTHAVLVDRLWRLYAWWTRPCPYAKTTPQDLLRFPPIPGYVEEFNRPHEDAWDLGRVRFFFDEIRAGRKLDPINIDNDWTLSPYPVIDDGHHRLAAHHIAGCKIIRAFYGGRVDLLNYLTGKRKTRPR